MKKKEGLSLIELIVSMVIFGLVIVGVILFNTSNTRAVVRSERNAKRILLQEKAIEEFKSYLKSYSVTDSRFDSIWSNNEIGDTLWKKEDDVEDIVVVLETDEFIPDQSADVSDVGVYLQVRVISTDEGLDINDTVLTYISRHD